MTRYQHVYFMTMNYPLTFCTFIGLFHIICPNSYLQSYDHHIYKFSPSTFLINFPRFSVSEEEKRNFICILQNLSWSQNSLVQIPQARSPMFSSVFLCTCHSYGTGICYVDPWPCSSIEFLKQFYWHAGKQKGVPLGNSLYSLIVQGK